MYLHLIHITFTWIIHDSQNILLREKNYGFLPYVHALNYYTCTLVYVFTIIANGPTLVCLFWWLNNHAVGVSFTYTIVSSRSVVCNVLLHLNKGVQLGRVSCLLNKEPMRFLWVTFCRGIVQWKFSKVGTSNWSFY